MKIFIFFYSFLFAFLATSQDFDKAKMDSFFNILEQNNQAMGTVAISQNGKIVYQRSTGFLDNTNEIILKANENTRYHIGSISKMFTAVLIFQLIEAKKLSLDTKLSKFFKSIPNSKKITIAHLLQHRSGIYNFTDAENYEEIAYSPKTEAELVKLISSYPADFQPDTKASYSNSNYVLLGFIIEKLYKKPLAEVLKMQICDKVGLKNTYLSGKIKTENKEAFSFVGLENWEKMPETDMSVPRAAGAIVATTADLLTFIEALFTEKLINKQHLDKMKTIKEGYGMAMFEVPFYDKKSFGHTGGIDGFVAVLTYFEKENLALTYCSNGVNYPFNDVLIAVLSIYFGKNYELPSFKEVELSEEYLKNCEGIYSSKNFPLKITLTKKGKKLFAQAEGQSEFPLSAAENGLFKFDSAGIIIQINEKQTGFNFKQGGKSFDFEK